MWRREYARALSGQRAATADRSRTRDHHAAARGLSSPAIAERLTLSARTVEGHVYRAMAKTGTSSRDKLAALLHATGRVTPD
jgi:DNA-binding NarL/FixJ family response regulator